MMLASRPQEDWLLRMDAHKPEIMPLFRVRLPSPSNIAHQVCIVTSIQTYRRHPSAMKHCVQPPDKDSTRTLSRICLQDTYGADDATRWWVRWRVFYLACSELFAFNGGSQWGVGHYLFQKKG